MIGGNEVDGGSAGCVEFRGGEVGGGEETAAAMVASAPQLAVAHFLRRGLGIIYRSR